MPTPEQMARVLIDRQLAECGWVVQPYASMNIHVASGVAICEFPLATGFADYLLYVNGKVIGVIEAKPEGTTLSSVELQTAKYTVGLREMVPHYRLPLPFGYESTGSMTYFTNGLDPEPRSRQVSAFHRPEELLQLTKLQSQLRANLRKMPALITTGLWKAQIEAVHNLEKSLSEDRPRSLIQMATGSGKTFTACTFCYRLIRFVKAKRILFLVDRNTLGKQAYTEFAQFISPYSKYRFDEEYSLQRMTRNAIEPASKIVITTIQRVYSMLKGEEDFEEEAEEESIFEHPLDIRPQPVVYNPRIPIGTFDYVIVDECHRSIYNVWRDVLTYFDASIIGLTATPSKQTLGFFNGNLVQNYSHEKAVADGVNVGYDVYRISTKITKDGATLEKEPGLYVPIRDKRTLTTRMEELDDDLTYTANQLDRDVVNQSQIRLVVKTFRERLFTDIFQGRTEVPKTLVFAKDDRHAEDIVRVIREEFGKGNDFCQKITSKSTAKKPDDLLNDFRNSYNPRVAVTVDLMATGTDVRPLECLLFMRNIVSASYFEQMKGRGVRVIKPSDLLAVTPDAKGKTRFVVVDAVGVCENDKTTTKPLDRKPTVSLATLLQWVAQGVVDADVVSTLASRLTRLDRQLTLDQREELQQLTGESTLNRFASELLMSIDPDANARKAREQFGISDPEEPSDEHLNEVEAQNMTDALKPFHAPKLREAIIAIQSSHEQVIDEVTPDQLLIAGYDEAAKDKAHAVLADFRRFLDEHKDEIGAISILYSRPYKTGLRYSQVKELAREIERHLAIKNPESQLWNMYAAVEPDKVMGKGGKALVDLVAIVRHALHPSEPLIPVEQTVDERYYEWLAGQKAAGVEFNVEQRKWLDAIKDHIAKSLSIEQDDFGSVPFNQMGGLGKLYHLFGDRISAMLKELNERLAA